VVVIDADELEAATAAAATVAVAIADTGFLPYDNVSTTCS
jgi:hypothetical protein